MLMLIPLREGVLSIQGDGIATQSTSYTCGCERFCLGIIQKFQLPLRSCNPSAGSIDSIRRWREASKLDARCAGTFLLMPIPVPKGVALLRR
jgi:hypothetical protein